MKRFILLLASVLLFSNSAQAQDSLDLSPGTNTVPPGTTLELELDADFSSSVIGGEIRVEYDPAVLHLEAVDWNVAYGDDPLLRCPPQAMAVGARGCEGRADFVAMGSLSGLPTGNVGDLVFTTIAEGTTTVRLVSESPFADLGGSVVSVTLGESQVTVVPEPGFATALAAGGLAIGVARRKRNARRLA